MITIYHRPASLDQALALLAHPDSVPLGGGTWINSPGFNKSAPMALVDLQDLGLGQLASSGQGLDVGACVTLQQLFDAPEVPGPIKKALRLEAAANLRNMATVAGTLVASDGRSPLATILLALDAKLTVASQSSAETVSVGEMLALRGQILARKLITRITLSLNPRLAWESVSRTPADKPIVGVALVRWTSGRVRLALGGFGPAPLLALDAADEAGLQAAARSAFHEASDPWASAEYRMDVAATLAGRCLESLKSHSN